MEWTGYAAHTPRKSHTNYLQNQTKTMRALKCAQRSPPTGMDLYQLQSEELAEGTLKARTQENLKFVDAGMKETIMAPGLGPFSPDSDEGARLGNFLSRPVEIDSYNWTGASTGVVRDLHPWTLYFSDPAVKRKLDNYKLLRCKLHLKFVVNASPFYYGSMRACYNPLDSGLDDFLVQASQIKLSQTPGVYLEPAVMTSSEMQLPFVWPNSWLDVASEQEFYKMGRLQYIVYSGLRSANGVGAPSVRITLYAWAEDVELAGLTSASSLQSDEYVKVGPISGPASAVADVASRLGDVPVIGPFATATAIGANAVAGVARLFGFSNPPVISDVMPYAPKAFHSFSSVDTSVPMDKLALDPKNEVTVDNSVTGAGDDDPLLLQPLLERESFVQGTGWSDASAPGTILWSAPVTPIIVDQSVVSGVNVVKHYTPAAYFGKMFRFWRGGMTYRFRFIKSRYHTGRVQIVWDPHGLPGADFATTTNSRIVDVQVEDEVVITIPYKQSAAWLKTTEILNNYSNGPAPLLTYDPLAHNGYIQVRVLNTLTGPATAQNLDILVYASMSPDAEMSVPNKLPGNLSMFQIQSAEVEVEDITGSATTHVTPGVSLVTVGESVSSLRTLLHRSSFVQQEVVGDPKTGASTYVLDGHQTNCNYFPRIPRLQGYDSFFGTSWGSRVVGSNASPYNYTTTHPIPWVINCFAGYRGSVVHHFNVETNGTELASYISAERDDRTWILNGLINARNRFTTTQVPGNPSALARFAVNSTSSIDHRVGGQRGMALTNSATQTAMSVVSPQYSAWRFRPAFEPIRDLYPADTGRGELESVRLDVALRRTVVGSNSAWPLVSHYVAAGVDFNPVYFVCTPTLFTYNYAPSVDSYQPTP